MALLKATLSTKADLEKLPEPLRTFYLPQKDGSYLLDAEMTVDPEADEARQALQVLRELEEQAERGEVPERLRPAFDKVFSKRGERTDAAKDEQIANLAKQLAAKTGSVITAAATKKGAKPHLLPNIMSALTATGVDGTVWSVDTNDKVTAMKDGQVRFGKTLNAPMSVDEGLVLLQHTIPEFFLPSFGAGASNNAGGSGVQDGVMRISKADAQNVQKWRAADEQAKTLKVPLVTDDNEIVGGYAGR